MDSLLLSSFLSLFLSLSPSLPLCRQSKHGSFRKQGICLKDQVVGSCLPPSFANKWTPNLRKLPCCGLHGSYRPRPQHHGSRAEPAKNKLVVGIGEFGGADGFGVEMLGCGAEGMSASVSALAPDPSSPMHAPKNQYSTSCKPEHVTTETRELVSTRVKHWL